jgi:hypothetical protein
MRHTALVVLVLFTVGSPATAQRRGPECLHDRLESQENRTRREQAVALAQDINRAQGLTKRFGRMYAPFDQLVNVPAPPRGFQVQHHTDGSTYVFSIKDTLDPCRYAIFSDQSADLYEATPSAPNPGVKLLSRN